MNIMIREQLAADEYYHVCHRGNNKQPIFFNDSDKYRFLFLLLYMQSPGTEINDTGARTQDFKKFCQHPMLPKEKGLDELEKEVLLRRKVELASFCLIPNHFHVALYAKTDDGISRYMQRVLNSYTKYVNLKYERTGHLFQGPYKLIHQKDNDQFLYLTTYIHRNVRELAGWANREEDYKWSSYQDYTKENRWGDLLTTKHINEQFVSKEEYKKFVEESPAKLGEDEEL